MSGAEEHKLAVKVSQLERILGVLANAVRMGLHPDRDALERAVLAAHDDAVEAQTLLNGGGR